MENYRERAREIVSKMSLEEKADYVTGVDFWHIKGNEASGLAKTMVADGPHGLRKQDESLNNAGVDDSITSVCFPTAAGTAASFDREMMYGLGSFLGEEAYLTGLSILLGPAINIKRSPLCGRNFEYMSEDPYLTGELAASYINGVQSMGVGTALKHFAANNQEKRRASSSSVLDERAFREIYLAAFETAVKKAQPKTVMCSYNKINGTYAAENKYLLTDILRDEWGFLGYTMTDWSANSDRVKGIAAGMDLEMPGSGDFNTKKLLSAVANGDLDEAIIDTACERIIAWALESQPNADNKSGGYNLEAHHKAAREFAAQSMVLLKNKDGILPLSPDSKIVFIGEFAKKPRYQGGGSSHVKAFRELNAFDEARAYADVTYSKGFDANFDKLDKKIFVEAVEAAKNADIAVVFAGLPESMETEGVDRQNINLPDVQNALISKIAEVNKNVVVVLHNGSPVAMPWANEVSGILEAYLSGETSGGAVCDILFGAKNPSAKLAETFPLALSDTPCYNYFPGNLLTAEYRESIFVGYRYYDTANIPVLFPFGHGLSYTTFEYSDLAVSYDAPFSVSVSFKIKNTGKRAGAEIAQIYVSMRESQNFRAKKELKGFEKVFLEPDEEKTVTVALDRMSFSFYSVAKKGKGVWAVENGNYDILIGKSSADIMLSDTVKITDGADIDLRTEKVALASYYSLEIKNVTDSEFERLLGVALPGKTYPSDHFFDMTATIEQAKGTKWGGRIYRFISKQKWLKKNPLAFSGALETPITNLIQISQGRFDENCGDALLNIINNSKPVKNIFRLLFAIFKAKNELKALRRD